MSEPIERTCALLTMLPDQETRLASALWDMGLPLPKIGYFTEAGGLLLARTAPNQILAMRAGFGVPLMDELAPLRAVAGLIDLSDARTALRVRGPSIADRLAHLLPIDLHPTRFGPGQCANTLMAHLSVLVLQHGPDDYELQCGRSFASSFFRAVEAVAGSETDRYNGGHAPLAQSDRAAAF